MPSKPALVAAALLALLAARGNLGTDAAAAAPAATSADGILRAAGVRGGLVVHLGCGDGKLTAALRAGDAFLVQGLDVDPASVEAARAGFQAAGLGGGVTADRFDGKHLPYVDNLVSLLVISDPYDVDWEEMLRVLRPGGVALPLQADGTPAEPRVKPWPPQLDEWTHFLHGPDNNAVSRDQVVGPPRCLQWISEPKYGRHHDRLASLSALVSAGGRLFSIEDRAPALSIALAPDWRRGIL